LLSREIRAPALRPASAVLKSEKTHHSEVANSKLTFHATSYSLPSDVSPEPKPPRHAKGSTHADWVGFDCSAREAGTVVSHSFLVGKIRDTVDLIRAN